MSLIFERITERPVFEIQPDGTIMQVDDPPKAQAYVALPVDTDGKPIHVGDWVDILHNGRHVLVMCMTLFNDGTWHVYGDVGGGFDPSITPCRVSKDE